MLVPSRKCGVRIVIPNQNILVTVLEVRGERVRPGIEAPEDVPIQRQELSQRMKRLKLATDDK